MEVEITLSVGIFLPVRPSGWQVMNHDDSWL